MLPSSRSICWGLTLILLSCACKEVLKPEVESIQVAGVGEEQLRKVALLPTPGHILVLGGIRFDQELIRLSTDAGKTWTASEVDFELGKIIFDLYMVDDSLGFATALDGKILRTRDGGRHFEFAGQTDWSPNTGMGQASDSVFVVVGGSGYDEGHIWRSADRGISWQRVDTFDFEFRDVAFVEENIGLACGYGVILKTRDGGLTWDFTSARNEFFSALHFPQPDLGFAVGRTGTILRSRDQGDSWEKLRNGNLRIFSKHSYNDVLFLDSDRGYIVGDFGLMLETQDGGDNWNKIETHTSAHLFSLDYDGQRNMFVSGEEGLLFRLPID